MAFIENDLPCPCAALAGLEIYPNNKGCCKGKSFAFMNSLESRVGMPHTFHSQHIFYSPQCRWLEVDIHH